MLLNYKLRIAKSNYYTLTSMLIFLKSIIRGKYRSQFKRKNIFILYFPLRSPTFTTGKPCLNHF